ncbi:hypothetical protein [Erythrobacter sp. JK5]|uniref:hypothetical protein n=1 Tax=Erythrobacter sp. JK5 TaxID=2829500 RepID=UPI001BA53670|nr:hypothetical protein [Erythrobacter sp. JK5]QUL38166.1 hypothetical protein KDC96_01710 [Erythrobacter sp. JK5]
MVPVEPTVVDLVSDEVLVLEMRRAARRFGADLRRVLQPFLAPAVLLRIGLAD